MPRSCARAASTARCSLQRPISAGREEILRVHTRGKPLGDGRRPPLGRRQTAGLTGADLANIANEAAIFAGRSSQRSIRQSDFEDAMERVVAGLQQRKVVTEKERRILAYHEAGHAVMSHLTGDLLPGPEGDDRLARPGARVHAQPARPRTATCTPREELVRPA